MGKFDNIQRSKQSKKFFYSNSQQLYKKFQSVNSSYSYLESLNVDDLLKYNRKKFNKDLITLWAKLEMKSFIDYKLGNTFNLYFINCAKRVPVNKFDNYNFLYKDTRKLNLLDIKFIKHFEIEKIRFENTYLATYEIMDNNEDFRPYVLLFVKDDNDNFVEYGYGYDSNNNDNVELFIPSFNYPIFLTDKGFIISPLSNKKIKLDVLDYITQNDIGKLLKQKT